MYNALAITLRLLALDRIIMNAVDESQLKYNKV